MKYVELLLVADYAEVSSLRASGGTNAVYFVEVMTVSILKTPLPALRWIEIVASAASHEKQRGLF